LRAPAPGSVLCLRPAERALFSPSTAEAFKPVDNAGGRRPDSLPALLPGTRRRRGGLRARRARLDEKDSVRCLRRRAAERRILFSSAPRPADVRPDARAVHFALVADRGGYRFLRRRIQTLRYSRRPQLVSQYRSQLGADAVSRRRQTAATLDVRRGRARRRSEDASAQGSGPGRIADAGVQELHGDTRCRALDAAGAPRRG